MINIFLRSLFIFILFLKSGVSQHQTFYHLAAGNEPILIDNSDFTKLDEATSKAVVAISAEGMKNIYINQPQFKKYYQAVDPHTGKQLKEVFKSSGSAVIISADGYLITCAHIVSESRKITVRLSDYRKYTARIVASYPEIDLAILKIEDLKGAKLPFLKLGSSDALKRGAFVAAIGNTLNSSVGKTFTDAHISATRRRLNISTLGSSVVVLQHNVAVNPGNSGGALVNNRGNLVGITNAMLSNGSSIGFSMPINTIKGYLEKFFKKGEGSSFGLFDVHPVTEDVIDRMHAAGFSYSGGLVISRIREKTPPAEAGLKEGDIVVSVDGVLTEMPEDLRNYENVTEPGKNVNVLVWRDQSLLNCTTKSIKYTKEMLVEQVKITGNHPLNGIEVIALTSELAQKMNMPSTKKGLLVVNDLKAPNGLAPLSAFGGASFIQKGDLLIAVNNHKLEKTSDLTTALQSFSQKRTFSMRLVRKGQEIQFTINGFGMPDAPESKKGIAEGAGSSAAQKGTFNQDPLEPLKRQLQELFKWGQVGGSSPKQFSSNSEQFNDKQKDIISEALKHIPAQMA